ncbi:hypothetical protein DVH24_006615 [Malus domestica]|uniref:Uncharacterized protein n=1 Tax=Malus domestica TaxID=3750 RepID=A0A498KCT8_MALDO|nr:hypothetical protein DVH24_006615 [Malus domestica]
MCLICTCPPPFSTRLFGNSLASGSIRTLNLSEFGKFSCEFSETKPSGRGWGPKQTISFGNSLASSSIETPKLSEFGQEHS